MRRQGFNWLRVWATWSSADQDVSAVDSEGHPREPFLGRLQWLVAECDRRGLVVDVTLTRGAQALTGVPRGRLPDLAAHQQAVATLVARAQGVSQLVSRSRQRARRSRRPVRVHRGAQDAAGAGPPARSAAVGHRLLRRARSERDRRARVHNDRRPRFPLSPSPAKRPIARANGVPDARAAGHDAQDGPGGPGASTRSRFAGAIRSGNLPPPTS